MGRCSTAVAGLALLGLACGGGSPVSTGANTGSSIVLLSDGRLAVVNPDQGSISLVAADTLEVSANVDVGGHPRALLQASSGLVWVTTHQGGHVVLVDPKAATVSATLDVCSGTTGLAESPDHSFIAVACEWAGQVMRVDATTHGVTSLLMGLARPSAVTFVGGSLVVSELTGGNIVEVTQGVTTRVSLVPPSASYRPALTKMTANLAAAVVPAFGHLYVPHELVNHTGDDTDETVADDYGHVLNGAAKINAAVTQLSLNGEAISNAAEVPAIYARFNGVAEHAFCGPSAVAAFGDHFLLVAHVSTNDVALLDTTATDPAQRLVASWTTGVGPSGIAVDAAHELAYVDNALDGSISKLDLSVAHDASAPTYKAQLTLIRGLPSPYSTAALAGRKIFFDASNAHETPSRSVACATCHPAGADDGLTWFIHTTNIPLKRRRTPHLANAHTGTAPFHWDGEFATMADLTQSTMTELMAGDGLLIDMTTLQPYVDEIVEQPEPPPQDADSVTRGKQVFHDAQCDTCHVGTVLTDNQSHIVLTPESLMADDVFLTANTPALHGLWFRAPFFHDGRSSDLHDLLTRSDASLGGASQLSAAPASTDLIAFLE